MRRAVILATLVLCICPAITVLAHGTFVDARPLPGVGVGGVVDEVAFLFPEDLVAGAGSITVTGPTGIEVPTAGEPEYPIGAVIRLPIEQLTEPGSYRVDYRVLAADGFVFEGSFEFTYDVDAEPLDPLPYGRQGPAWWLVGVGGALAGVLVLLARKRRRDSPGDAG
ncbi:MAG: copper resistance protein CopC [Acidimicrobiia bacterium]